MSIESFPDQTSIPPHHHHHHLSRIFLGEWEMFNLSWSTQNGVWIVGGMFWDLGMGWGSICTQNQDFGCIWTPNPSLMYTSIAALLCKEQVNVSLPACEMQYPCFHWERRCALHPAQQRLRLSSPSVSQISQPAGWTTPLRISLFKRRLNGNKFLDSVWWPFHFPQTSLLRFILWSSEFFLAPAGVKPEEILSVW